MKAALSRTICVIAVWFLLGNSLSERTAEDFLAQGDELLAAGSFVEAADAYRQGVNLWHEDESLVTGISLYTNMGTALSSEGLNEQAIISYQAALKSFRQNIGDILDTGVKQEAQSIAAQSAFFLGMVFQDVGQPKDAANAYRQAHELDELHWAAMANLGAVLHDELADHAAALEAYNVAYAILTGDKEPTDAPAEPRHVLSQLQYRIGLCIAHDTSRKCALQDDTTKVVDCNELAAHAFSMAVQYDPDNEAAAHMLATVTADATVERASNTYVKSLFDDYAKNFEHSLVQELGYTGYERLRRGFDRYFGGKPPTFATVVDAGCGTGLVGEQFRNISKTLIGVDLSEAILREAVEKRPNLYDDVVVGDVTQVFRDRKPISLIIAADSYIYFGDLVPLFDAMKDGLKYGGYVAFTLENVSQEDETTLRETKPDWRWQLTASGRFAHRKEYVAKVAEDHDIFLKHYEPLDGFRFERGVPVRGHLFVMQAGKPDQEL
jgi:predicted TPR repeat methyltransferase